KRRTPCAMTAMPPMTIHGAPASSSALTSAASASSRSRSPLTRLPGTLLDAHPAATHLFDGALAHRIARPGPLASRRQRGSRRERLGHGLLRVRTFRAHQLALTRRRRLLSAAHSRDGVLVTHEPRLPHDSAAVILRAASGRMRALREASSVQLQASATRRYAG